MNWNRIKVLGSITFAVLLAVGLATLAGVSIVRLVNTVEVSRSVPYQTFHIMLTGASFALIFFSVIVALVGVFGWQEIENIIERKVEAAEEESDKEHRGRIRLSTGVMYGRLSRDESGEEIDITQHNLLSEAIDSTEKAYKLLSESDAGFPTVKAANNLAFYYALQDDDLGSKKNAATAIELTEDLKSHHKFAGEADMIDTYCRVVAVYYSFYDRPEKRVDRAIDLSSGVQNWKGATLSDKKQAQRTLNRLHQAQRELSGVGED